MVGGFFHHDFVLKKLSGTEDSREIDLSSGEKCSGGEPFLYSSHYSCAYYSIALSTSPIVEDTRTMIFTRTLRFRM